MLLASCATTHRGVDAVGNKVVVVRDNDGKIIKQIHKCENKKIVVVYNR